MLKQRTGLIIGLSLLAAAGVAQPQNGADTSPPTGNKVVLSRGQTISSALEGMAKAANAIVAVDPLLTGRVSEATSKLPLDQGITVIAKENRAQWRKVYLAENEIPRTADGRVDARRLKKAVQALEDAPPLTLGVVNPATGGMTVSTRGTATSPMMQEWAKTRKPVYLIYVPGPDETAPVGGMMGDAMPPGGVQAFNAMTPEQRAQWMKDHNATIVTSGMSPEERERILQSLPPEQRADIARRMGEAAANGAQTVLVFKQKTQ